MVSTDYDVVLYLPTNAPRTCRLSSGFLECEDTAGLEPPDRLNDRFDYELHAGETYYLVVDANQPDTFGDFSLFSHYGACGAVPAPQCEVDTDCLLGQRCTEQRQCITPIGTCDDPTQITELGTYNNRLGTARNLLDPRLCDACPNPGGGRCGEAVYLYQPQHNGRVCVSTSGSNYDTVLYARRSVCGPLR